MTEETKDILKKYEGKVVATRGYVSGVNVGRLVHFDPENKLVILVDSYFLRSWEYTTSHGSMTSLSSGDITGGTITKILKDNIISDVGQLVICPESVLEICEKFAK